MMSRCMPGASPPRRNWPEAARPNQPALKRDHEQHPGDKEVSISSDGPHLEEVKEILNDIIKEDARASEVINRMRAFLKKSKMELQPLD